MIMKLRNLLACVVASAMAFVGCEQENANLGAPSITLSETEITFDNDGGEATLTVTASRDWTVQLDEDAAKWLIVDPATGKPSAEAQTVTVSVLSNDGYSREASVPFSIGMQTKYLTVKQDGEKGSADALILYANDMDNGKVEKVNDKWPYPDQSDSWRNEKGSGIANVKYASEGVSVRSVSSTNNLWFPAKGGSYFSIKDIALNSTSSLELMFDVVHGSPNGYKKVFSTSAFKVFVSKDNANWVELPYDLTVKADNEFDTASAKFTVAGVENLSVAFQFLGAEDGYRLARLNLLVYAGTDAAAVDFSKATAMDFGEGSTPGNDPGTGDLPAGTGEGTEASPYDAAKATNLASALGQDDKITGVYVKGIVKSIKEVSSQYGNATYYITDADGAANFYVYRGKNVGNTAFTSTDQIKVGDNVVIYGDLMNYMGNSPQLGQGNYLVSINGGGDNAGGGNEGGNDGPVEEKNATVKEFLDAAVSTNVFYTVTGAIVSIEDINTQYQSATLTIQDNTGSLYVYRMKAAEGGAAIDAIGLSAGDELTVRGNRGEYNGNPQMVNGVYVSHVDKENPADQYNWNTSIVFSESGYANAQSVNNVEIKLDDNVTCVFSKGTANNEPAYYDSGSAVRMYQNGALLDVKVAGGKKIKAIELTFGSSMYYLDADSGTLSAESAVRTWTGDASAVRFTATGTDKNHRAYVAAIKVAYE